MKEELVECKTQNYIIKAQDSHLNVAGTCLHAQRGLWTEIRKGKEVVAVIYSTGVVVAVNKTVEC